MLLKGRRGTRRGTASFSFLRAGVAACCVVGLLAGARWYSTAAAEIITWQGLARSDINGFLAFQPGRPVAPWNAERGRILQDRLFPPQHPQAARVLQSAIAREPANSATWTRLASSLLFQGDTDRARRALAVADALDPCYPDQRLRSIQIRQLLGDREQALDMATSLAAVAPAARPRIFDELVWSGEPIASTWDRLGLPHRPPGERLAMARHLAASGQLGALLGAWGRIPPEWMAPETRPLVLEAALKPVNLDLLKTLEGAPDRGPSLVPQDDLTLEKSPFEKPHAFGWRRSAPGSELSVRFIPPDRMDARLRSGLLSGAIVCSAPLRRHARATGEIFRFVLPRDTATTLTLSLQEPDADRLGVAITARTDEITMNWREGGMPSVWEPVTFHFDPAPADRFVTLTLGLTGGKAIVGSEEVTVLLGPVRLEYAESRKP